MEWYQIFKSDVLVSYRVFINRIKEHPIITIFFVFIAIAGAGVAVYVGNYLDNMDMGDNPIYIERWVFSIIFFSFILGKVALYTYRKVLREREMLTLFSQPLDMYQITIGKYLANLTYIGVLLLTGFLLIYSWLLIIEGPVGIPPDILAEGLFLSLLALSLGFSIPVFMQVKPLSKKLLTLSLNIVIIGVVSVLLRYFTRDYVFYITLMVLTLLSFAGVFYASRFILPAWTALKSKPLTHPTAYDKDRLMVAHTKTSVLSREAWFIAKKELIIMIREKDAIVTICAVVFMTIASVGVYLYYGPGGAGMGRGDRDAYIYPGILAMFLFLGTLMLSALIGLAMISVEGRALYILKLLPIHNIDVLKGKSLALMLINFPIIIPMAFVLPIVAHFPLLVTLFFIIFSIVLVVSFTGIGIWGGTKFPNFDPTARNMPDIISQFFIMSICVISTAFLGGIPAYLMIVNNSVGLVAILVAVGWAFTVLIWGMHTGQKAYDNIEADKYM